MTSRPTGDDGPTEALLAALQHPLRARILAILTDRSASTSEVVEAVDEPAAKVRYHLRALARSGLIGLQGARKRRGAREHLWFGRTSQLVENEHFESLSPTQIRATVLHFLRLIFTDATAGLRDGSFDRRPDSFIVRYRTQIDERGWSELVAALRKTMLAIETVRNRSAERLGESGEEPLTITAALLLFELGATAEPFPGDAPLWEPSPSKAAGPRTSPPES